MHVWRQCGDPGRHRQPLRPDGLSKPERAAENPKCQFVKTSKQPPRESRGREQGRGVTEIREPREPAGMQDESRKPGFRDTLPAATERRAASLLPRVSQRGGEPTKRQSGFARGKSPNRRKKPPEAPFFHAFHTPGNVFAARNFRLCGKKKISFRKEIPFLPHKNARRGGETLHTDSSRARFLTLRGLFPPFRSTTRTRNRAEILPF